MLTTAGMARRPKPHFLSNSSMCPEQLVLVGSIGYWGFLRRYGRSGAWREPWPMAAPAEHRDAQ